MTNHNRITTLVYTKVVLLVQRECQGVSMSSEQKSQKRSQTFFFFEYDLLSLVAVYFVKETLIFEYRWGIRS